MSMFRITKLIHILGFILFTLGCLFGFACVPDDDDAAGSGDDDDDDDDNDDDDTGDDDAVEPDPAVQALLDEYIAFTGEPGIALGWTRVGEPTRIQTAGLADVKTGAPLHENNVYRIGSGTKPFIAAVTMQLVDEGQIGLDDPVQNYLPQYTQWPGLTVRHLLAMQSGILDYLNSNDFWLYALVHLGEPFTPEQLIQYALNLDVVFLPGEGCDYSNTNYVLLGMIIERVTGYKAKDVLQDRIFDPLGLSLSFLDVAGQEISDLANGYVDVELAGPVIGLDEHLVSLIDLIVPQFVIEGYLIEATYMLHPTFAWTAGGMVSSPGDVAAFMRAWVGKELASEQAMAEVMDFNECSILGADVQYGLGLTWQETEFGDAIGHGGLHFGYSTMTYHFVDTELTFSAINNYLPEQIWYIQDELLYAMHNAPLPAQQVCRPPDEFLDANEQNLAQVRFRGPVVVLPSGDDPDEEDVDNGISGARLRMDDFWLSYYGYGAYAAVDGSSITVESMGPKRSDEWDMRSMTLELSTMIFEQLDENGFAAIDNDRLDLFVPLVFDIGVEVEPGVTKFCFHAVPDIGRTSQFYFCDFVPPPVNPGDTLKVYANIPMTKNPTVIKLYMA